MIRSLTMPRLAAGTALAAIAAAGSAHAGALEQVVPSTIRLLYEEGRYVEFNAVYADPDQSGDGINVPPNPDLPDGGFFPGNTGDIFDSSWNFSGAYKADLNDRFSYVLGFDQPYTANTNYGAGSFAFPFYQGTIADFDTYQLTAVLSYDLTPAVKIFGGARAQQLEAVAAVPLASNYRNDADAEWGYGYLLGAAYERPEIALRVALTYYSSISYDLSTAESIVPFGSNTRVTQHTTTDLETPQSVQLDFQTGVAPKTLVFGYVRWVDWSEFDVSPPVFEQVVGAPLVEYESDAWTYNLGIGRQLTDKLAGSFAITYEPDTGDVMPTQGPYDGQTTGTLGLSYDYGKWNFSGGVSYGVLGDAKNNLGTDFNDGSVWGAGLRVAYSF